MRLDTLIRNININIDILLLPIIPPLPYKDHQGTLACPSLTKSGCPVPLYAHKQNTTLIEKQKTFLNNSYLPLIAISSCLVACSGGGGGDDEDGPAPALSAPTGLNGSFTGNIVTLLWNASNGAENYIIYGALGPGIQQSEQFAFGETADSTPSANIEFQPGAFTEGQPIYFAVAAKNSASTSGLSNIAEVIFGGGPPPPPPTGDDPLLSDQWHLRNTGQFGGTPGEDANVFDAWQEATGMGVRIAVVDDGLEIQHEDLLGNVVPGMSWNYVNGTTDPTGPAEPQDGHGTSVAGVAAAVGNNSRGGRGAAYDAELVGYNFLEHTTLANQVDAMTRDAAVNWVSNNSWGYSEDGRGIPAYTTAEHVSAIEHGLTQGRNAKGLIYVFAAGNDALNLAGRLGDDANYDEANSINGCIVVGAIGADGKKSPYSENGANLLISAPSNSFHNFDPTFPTLPGITTVDRSGVLGYNRGQSGDYNDLNYTNGFGGTSSAAPLVTGVIGLMLQANPNLSWRDVPIILARTARKVDPNDSDWRVNGAGLNVNHKYGFGAIDAQAAVQTARTWQNVEEIKPVYTQRRDPSLAIPDDPDNQPGSQSSGVSDTIQVSGSQIQRIEYVNIMFASDHTYSGDLEIVLTSPSGTQSLLAETHPQLACQISNGTISCMHAPAPYDRLVFGSRRHLDEPADGQWTLTVRDGFPQDTGMLTSWQLDIYGR